jgi:hypothetical protein
MSMVRERCTLPFRWLLPITQLVICVVVLWPLRGLLVWQVKQSIHAYQRQGNPVSALPEDQKVSVVVPPSPELERELTAFDRLERQKWVPVALNLPCSLVQLPYVILNPTKQEWIPRDMDIQTWRMISWPLAGCLFWWIAGRGFEGVIAARRRLIFPIITWIETIPSAALSLFCAVAAVCLPLFSGHDGDFPMKFFVAGVAMWAVLGGVVVAARVAQWRLRKHPRLTDSAEISPA